MLGYRRFLMVLQSDLQTAISEAENMQWHHLPAEAPEYGHYLRLLTWEREVNERGIHYDAVKVKSSWRKLQREGPGSAQASLLGGHGDRQELGSGRPD